MRERCDIVLRMKFHPPVSLLKSEQKCKCKRRKEEKGTHNARVLW